MWRPDFFSSPKESRYLDDCLRSVEQNRYLRERADATIRALSSAEPVFADSMRTPQSPNHHAEGPFMESHIRLMLMSLYAILNGDLSILGIEEFRRMRGYEGEWQELEETIRGNAATFEVFALCHDAAKWSNIFFAAMPGTRGFELGFHQSMDLLWDDAGFAERARARQAYLDLYGAFAREHSNETDSQIQKEFFEAYGIKVRNAGHEKAIHSPVYRGLLQRSALARRLPDQSVDLLETMISHHMDPLPDFGREVNARRMDRYLAVANHHGYDADDFIDLLQAGVFLDMVCGNIRPSSHGYWHDPTVIINFFQSEHDFAPWKREEKQKRREEAARRLRQRAYREVGLDGVALLGLLGMEPGPAFGRLMKQIHEAIEGYGKMPSLPPDAQRAIDERIVAYRKKTFAPGL